MWGTRDYLPLLVCTSTSTPDVEEITTVVHTYVVPQLLRDIANTICFLLPNVRVSDHSSCVLSPVFSYRISAVQARQHMHNTRKKNKHKSNLIEAVAPATPLEAATPASNSLLLLNSRHRPSHPCLVNSPEPRRGPLSKVTCRES